MTQQSFPRPTVQLQPEALRLSPKQAEVLSTLQDFDGGARASDIAGVLGMHVNTARGHLDELVAKGAIDAAPCSPEGRGRPSMIFRGRVPNSSEVSKEYTTLIETLVTLLPITPEGTEQALELGRQWAQRMLNDESTPAPTSPETPNENELEIIGQKLRELGFDPSIVAKRQKRDLCEGTIALKACPFVTTPGERPSELLCSVHHGFLEEASTHAIKDQRVELTLTRSENQEPCLVGVRAEQ